MTVCNISPKPKYQFIPKIITEEKQTSRFEYLSSKKLVEEAPAVMIKPSKKSSVVRITVPPILKETIIKVIKTSISER